MIELVAAWAPQSVYTVRIGEKSLAPADD